MTTTAPRRPRIDPRIAERRNEVLRTAGRRRLRAVMALLVALIVGCAAIALTQTPVLDLDRVTVSGHRRTSAAAIRDASELQQGQPMLDIDLRATRRNIEALPWVLRARVHRDWPGTLVVRVVERVPAAVVARPDGRYAVVDQRGRVLAVTSTLPFGLAVVGQTKAPGPPGSSVPRATLAAVQVAVAMPARLRPLVGGVDVTPGGLELTLHGGGVVRIGDAADLDAKMQAALTVLVRVPPGVVAILDVRVARAPVLTRR